MGRRLYRFGHIMMGLAIVFGLALWLHFGIGGGWLHAKLGAVLVVLAFWIMSGRWLKRAAAGGALPTSRTLRLVNEIPVLLLVVIVYLVIAKPF
jgi:putative membrane protein